MGLKGPGQQYLVYHCVVNMWRQSPWYCLVLSPQPLKKVGILQCEPVVRNYSQEHTDTLTSFCSAVALTAGLSLVWSSRQKPVEPFWDSFLVLMLPWSISRCTKTSAYTQFLHKLNQIYLIFTAVMTQLTTTFTGVSYQQHNCTFILRNNKPHAGKATQLKSMWVKFKSHGRHLLQK